MKTFVCGALDKSTFRRKEIQTMLRAHGINNINSCGHQEYVLLRRSILNRLREQNKLLPESQQLSGKARHQMAINAVFRAMAFHEIRDDLTHAQNDEERRDILSRVENLKNQHNNEMSAKRTIKESFNTGDKNNRQGDGANEAIVEMFDANPHLHAALTAFLPHAHH